MDKEQLKQLKKISNELKAQFNLGKAGITNSFIKMVDEYLEAHNVVKIKASIAQDKNALSFYADEIAKETLSEIVEKKGYTFTLFRA